MAFGQQAGPPASARQIEELAGLVRSAGYGDFRDARHPLGLSQRQAGGRFTRGEAVALIDKLRASEDAGPPPDETPSHRRQVSEQLLRVAPVEQLAAELERRGWVVIAP